MPATIPVNHRTFRPSRSSTLGVSSESDQILERVSFAEESLSSSLALNGNYHLAMAELAEASDEVSQPNWDGFGAAPITQEASLRAESFLYALPADVSVPDVTPLPDGGYSFEWYGGSHRGFLISVDEGERVIYAGLDGKNRWKGVEVFDGKTIPSCLLEGINRITSGA